MEYIKGVVVRGKKAGRLLGFPTANIEVALGLAFGPGIYAGFIIMEGKKYQAALYLPGTNVIEAFLLDFSGDLYDKEVEVEILKKIREKQDFKSDAEAVEQITKDVVEIKKIFL